ncbi:MAG: glycosyltransferase, partial [Myxococcota bacterium]|nr:glycosyltransferase [Myxococcota bacterium]
MLVVHFLFLLISLGWCYALFRSIRAVIKKKHVLGVHHPAAVEGTLVSVVIPARNEEANIAKAIQSVLSQVYTSLEVLVFNDASSDQTGTITDRIAAQDSRVHALNGDGAPLPDGWFGKPWALERAQKHAKGDWILFMDAD